MSGEPAPYPLLVLAPVRRLDERAKRPGGARGGSHRPDASRQDQRLTPRFERLQASFSARRAELLADPTGTEPEQVLVLETVGPVEDFVRAVQRIDGLEYLGEFDEEDIPPDEDFYLEDSPERSLRGMVFLLMTNQQAMEQLLRLWRRFVDDPEARFEHGLSRFKRLFQLLHDLRPWGAADRTRDTGVLADWQRRIDFGHEVVPTEIELWFRNEGGGREAAEAEVRRQVEQARGQVVTSAVIPEVRYHALLARLPIASVQPLFETVDAIEMVRSSPIMLLKPTGQTVDVPVSDEGRAADEIEREPSEPAEPVVALLDGVPLEQHETLAGRLNVDDPDDFSADAPANDRRHGTAMASLILHGDLKAASTPLTSRLYVRPILTAGPDWIAGSPEQVPDDVLTVDLIYRAVRRMFDGDPGGAPAADTVRVINLSVGDSAAPFTRMLSSWARLLDWIAWNYQVLVVASAGNHPDDLVLQMTHAEADAASPDELQAATLRSLADHGRVRRLLPPAEAVNALTVGASPQDESGPPADGARRDLVRSPWLPAPYSALGLGFRRSIKPDVLLPGGRLLYERAFTGDGATSTFVPSRQPRSGPGQMAASPAGSPATLRGAQYTTGTSNAAALASRTVAQLCDVLVQLRDDGGADFLADRGAFAAALKALFVHGAQHGVGMALLEDAFGDRIDPRKLREFVCRFLGYGLVDSSLAFGASAQRATMVGGGRLPAEQADIFRVPLPPSLSGQTGTRRLTMTLAWLTPVNARDHRYRRARMWFDPPQAELHVTRQDADWRAVQRGTVQHEILEGQQAAAFADGDILTVQINCAAYAGKLDHEIPYGLVVSLEVAPELEVEVFAEVQQRIRPLIPVRPSS